MPYPSWTDSVARSASVSDRESIMTPHRSQPICTAARRKMTKLYDSPTERPSASEAPRAPIMRNTNVSNGMNPGRNAVSTPSPVICIRSSAESVTPLFARTRSNSCVALRGEACGQRWSIGGYLWHRDKSYFIVKIILSIHGNIFAGVSREYRCAVDFHALLRSIGPYSSKNPHACSHGISGR